MDEETQMFTVIYACEHGRMTACDHKHPTSEDALACVEKVKGLSIIEWVRDRRPQFSEFWRSPSLEAEEAMARLYKKLNVTQGN